MCNLSPHGAAGSKSKCKEVVIIYVYNSLLILFVSSQFGGGGMKSVVGLVPQGKPIAVKVIGWGYPLGIKVTGQGQKS